MVQAPVVSKTLLDSPSAELEVDPFGYVISGTGQSKRLNRLLKTLIDYLMVVPGLLLILPLLLLIAFMIKLDTPGPIIHRRRVLGRNGRQFDAFKFRTMFVNGEEILDQHPNLRSELDRNYKLKRDPRVTPVGRILRKYSLDELPQLFNVMNQDMSLVGPRIITPQEIVKYGRWGKTLMSVMPGLTGWWQVNGRSDTSYDERVNLDLEYIHNWSVWLDIKVLLLTIPAVLKGDGAY